MSSICYAVSGLSEMIMMIAVFCVDGIPVDMRQTKTKIKINVVKKLQAKKSALF